MTYYAVYDTGADADYAPFATAEEAIQEARSFPSNAFVVAVDDAPDGYDDSWSLWDRIDQYPRIEIG